MNNSTFLKSRRKKENFLFQFLIFILIKVKTSCILLKQDKFELLLYQFIHSNSTIQ